MVGCAEMTERLRLRKFSTCISISLQKDATLWYDEVERLKCRVAVYGFTLRAQDR